VYWKSYTKASQQRGSSARDSAAELGSPGALRLVLACTEMDGQEGAAERDGQVAVMLTEGVAAAGATGPGHGGADVERGAAS
jgi:hypothetical protein